MMTSRWEGFPMTVTEALEMGLAVIAYDIPALEPLVTDGIEGKIVPAFRRDKLVEAMEEIAASPDMRRKMSENALAKAQTLRPEEVVRQWLALIGDVLAW